MVQFWEQYMVNPDEQTYHGKSCGARAFREGFIYAMISKYATYDTGWDFSVEARIHDDILRRASAKGDWYDANTLAEAFFETREGKKILEQNPGELDKWREGGEFNKQVTELLAPWTYNAVPIIMKRDVPLKNGAGEYVHVGMMYQFVSPFDYDFRNVFDHKIGRKGDFPLEPYICAAPVGVTSTGKYAPMMCIAGLTGTVYHSYRKVDWPMSKVISVSANVPMSDDPNAPKVLDMPGGFHIPDISTDDAKRNIIRKNVDRNTEGIFTSMNDFYGYRNNNLLSVNSLYGQARALSKYVPTAEWRKVSAKINSYITKNYADLESQKTLELTEKICEYLKDQNYDFTFVSHSKGFAISIPSKNMSILAITTDPMRGTITDWNAIMERSSILVTQQFNEKSQAWMADRSSTPPPVDITLDFIKWRLGDETIKVKSYNDTASASPDRSNEGTATVGNIEQVKGRVSDFWWKGFGSPSILTHVGLTGADNQHFGHRVLFATSESNSEYNSAASLAKKYEARIKITNPVSYQVSDYQEVFGALSDRTASDGNVIRHSKLPIAINSDVYRFFKNVFASRLNRMERLPIELLAPEIQAEVSTEIVEIDGQQVERTVYNAEFARVFSMLTDKEKVVFNLGAVKAGTKGQPDTYDIPMTVEDIKSCPVKLDCAFLSQYVDASPEEKKQMYQRALAINKRFADKDKTIKPEDCNFMQPTILTTKEGKAAFDNLIENYPTHYYRLVLEDIVNNAKDNFVEELSVADMVHLGYTRPVDFEYGDVDDLDPTAVAKKELYTLAAALHDKGLTLDEAQPQIDEWVEKKKLELFGNVPCLKFDDDDGKTFVADNFDRPFIHMDNVCKYSDLYSGYVRSKKDSWATYKMIGALITQLPGKVSSWCYTDDELGAALAGKYKKLDAASYEVYMRGTPDGKIVYSGLSSERPMSQEMMEYLKTSLLNAGLTVDETFEIGIDKQGIMHYSGRFDRVGKTSSQLRISTFVKSGNIGQVVEFDEFGACSYSQIKQADDENDNPSGEDNTIDYDDDTDEVDAYDDDELTTEDQAGQKMMIIPGYVAEIEPANLSDRRKAKSLKSRLKLRGIREMLKQTISQNVKDTVYGIEKFNKFGANETVLNDDYKRSCDILIPQAVYQLKVENIRHFRDNGTLFTPLEDPIEEGKRQEALTDINVFETYTGRCRFPTKYIETCTTNCQSMLEHPEEDESKRFDFSMSDSVDNMNFRVLGEEFDGIFDPNMTGTAKSQGIVRYLVAVKGEDGLYHTIRPNADGHVTPIENEDGSTPECALSMDEMMKYQYFNTVDRRQMASSQLLTAYRTPRMVNAALLNLGGWTYDDGIVISKRLAEQTQILDHREGAKPGAMRSLMAQDKLSDEHGNKGVISCVIDGQYYSEGIRQGMKRIQDTTFVTESDSGDILFKTTIEFDGKKYEIKKEIDREEYKAIATDVERAKYFEDLVIAEIQERNGYKDMDDVLRVFYENPDLDMVMSPYSIASRMNGGSIRQLAGNPKPLILNGKVVEGGMGTTNVIVVDKPVDIKTHFYKKPGEGRNMSGQLIWGLESAGAVDVLGELTKYNADAVFKLREALIAVGMDLDPQTLEVKLGYDANNDVQRRNIFRLPNKAVLEQCVVDILKDGMDENTSGYVVMQNIQTHLSEDLSDFANNIHNHGGFLVCPAPLHFYRSKVGMLDADGNPIQGDGGNYQAYTDSKNMTIPSLSELSDQVGGNYTTANRYGIPIIPPGMRLGMGTQEHQITERYLRIYRNIIVERTLNTFAVMMNNDEQRQKLVDAYMSSHKCTTTEAESSLKRLGALMAKWRKSQYNSLATNFNSVQTAIADKFLSGKHNLMREGVFKKKLDHSATAVWSADPRLGINEVAMSLEHAKALGLTMETKDGTVLKEGAKVIVWRDPILMDGGVRYMDVVIDNTIEGVRINPLADKSFEGDFDGDTVGLKALDTQLAKDCAEQTLSHAANLLFKGAVNEPDENGNYPNGKYALYINDGMDVASNAYFNPELVTRRNDIQRSVNELDEISIEAKELFKSSISAYTKEVLSSMDGIDRGITSQNFFGDSFKSWLKDALNDRGIALNDKEMKKVMELTDRTADNLLKYMGIEPDEFDFEKSVEEQFADKVMHGTVDITKGTWESELSKKDALSLKALRMMKVAFGTSPSMSKLNNIINTCKNFYVEATSEYAKDALKGVGTAHIVIDSPNTQMQSIKTFVVDQKAKGKEKKIPDMARHLGIAIDMENDPNFEKTSAIVDDKGEVIPAAVADGTYREEDKRIWETIAYKADNTCAAGMTSQHGVSAMRNLCLKEVLELTYPITQGVLQSKHDPIDAKDKDAIIKFWGKKIWDGVKLTGDWDKYLDPECDPDVVIHDKHVPVGDEPCTPDEWKKQLKGMMKALKVDINPEFVDVLAENMTYEKDGKAYVYGLHDMIKQHGALMDVMSYSNETDVYSAIVERVMKPYLMVKNPRTKTMVPVLDKVEAEEYKKDMTKLSLLGTTTPTEVVASVYMDMGTRLDTDKSKRLSPEAVAEERFFEARRHELLSNTTIILPVPIREMVASANIGELTLNKNKVVNFGVGSSYHRDTDRFTKGMTFIGETPAEYHARAQNYADYLEGLKAQEESKTMIGYNVPTKVVSLSDEQQSVKEQYDEKKKRADEEREKMKQLKEEKKLQEQTAATVTLPTEPRTPPFDDQPKPTGSSSAGSQYEDA